MACTVPTSPVGYLTDVGRTYRSRSFAEGLSFILTGFTAGCGGYSSQNPLQLETQYPENTDLNQHLFPQDLVQGVHNPKAFEKFETTDGNGTAVYMRLAATDAQSGLGEFGVWGQIVYSPVNPVEVGTVFLYAIIQTPVICKHPGAVVVVRGVFL